LDFLVLAVVGLAFCENAFIVVGLKVIDECGNFILNEDYAIISSVVFSLSFSLKLT
jgi:hypothetical protein